MRAILGTQCLRREREEEDDDENYTHLSEQAKTLGFQAKTRPSSVVVILLHYLPLLVDC